MYEFAVLIFGGLVVWLAGKLVSQYGREMPGASGYVLMAALGVGYAYLADYSIFSAWGIGVRSDAVGHIVTGFMVAGLAHLWEEAMHFMRGFAHGNHEKKLRRAA